MTTDSDSPFDRDPIKLDHKNDQVPPTDSRKTIETRILDALENETFPQSPSLIAEKTGLNPNSVRARLSELREKGLIIRIYPGGYLINSAYGGGINGSDGGVLLRIQNLVVVSTVALSSKIEKHEKFEWLWPGVGKDDIGSLKVHVELGTRFNRVSWRLSASEGVEIQTVRVCRLCVEQMLRGIGFQVEDYGWEVHSVELLRDLFRVSLGLTSFSLDSLESTLMKIYAKPYGVRVERRVHRRMGFDEMLSVLMGSIPEFHLVDSVNDCVSKVEKLTVAVKYLNGMCYKINENYRGLQRFSDLYNAISTNLLKTVDNKRDVSG